MERYVVLPSKIITWFWDWFFIVRETRCAVMHHAWSSSLMRIPVIKVYGIYGHSELGRIWNALGNHLARKGVEYRRRWANCHLSCNLLSNRSIRCIFRTKPADNVILPASFPPKEPEPEIPASPLDLSAKEMEHVECLHFSVTQRLIRGAASLFACVCINILQFDAW